MFGHIYIALYECCTGMKYKERRPTLDSILRDTKQLTKDEFNFVLKQYFKLHAPPVVCESCC